MNYFVRLERRYSCKNKAHEAAQRLACYLDRLIVDDEGKQTIIDNFKSDIKEVDRDYPRCKPLPLVIKRGYDRQTNDTIIEIEGNFQLIIYQGE